MTIPTTREEFDAFMVENPQYVEHYDWDDDMGSITAKPHSMFDDDEEVEEQEPVEVDEVKPFTEASSMYAYRGVDNYMMENDLMGKKKLAKENVEDGIAALHTLSHTIAGGNVNDVKTTDGFRMNKFKQAIEDIDFDALSGDNLVEKSMSAAYLMKAAYGDSKNAPTGNSPRDQKRRQKLKDAQKAAQYMRKAGGKKGGVMDEFLEDPSAEEAVSNMPQHLHRALNLIGRVKSMGTINFSSPVRTIADPKGSKISIQYGGMSDLSKVDITELNQATVTEFLDDMVQYHEPHTEQPQKRVIFALYDFSGSMQRGEKQGYVLALLINLFDAVAKGDCTVIIAPFIMKIGKITVIQTKEEGLKYLKEFKSPTGGNTDVNSVIAHAHSLLDSGVVAGYTIGKDRAEVVVINDGEDDVDREQVPLYPTHAICLGVDNDNLKHICIESKGTYNSIELD